MRKLLVLGVLGLAAYTAYRNRHSFLPREGAFDEAGNPIVRVFVGPDCGPGCDEVEDTLKQRGVGYERVDVLSPAGQEYGIRQYPLTMVGRRRVVGNAVDGIVSMLAEAYGEGVLTYAERAAMAGHFDADGKPIVVLYGTQWCGYCKRQREFFASNQIAFADVDVEASLPAKAAYEALRGRGYPLVFIGYRRFEGYSDTEILDALAETK